MKLLAILVFFSQPWDKTVILYKYCYIFDALGTFVGGGTNSNELQVMIKVEDRGVPGWLIKHVTLDLWW